jgi:hypothetical protein
MTMVHMYIYQQAAYNQEGELEDASKSAPFLRVEDDNEILVDVEVNPATITNFLKTNPRQFLDEAAKQGVIDEELVASMVNEFLNDQSTTFVVNGEKFQREWVSKGQF